MSLHKFKTGILCILEKPAIELIELKEGKGLFPVGIRKMWNVPTKAQQFKQAQKISWITNSKNAFSTNYRMIKKRYTIVVYKKNHLINI